MNKIELERRTKEFSLRLIRFLESLPKTTLAKPWAGSFLNPEPRLEQTIVRRIGQNLRPILSIN